MQKSIKLTGLSTSPSDYQSSDGNLAAAINVVHCVDGIQSAHTTAPQKVLFLGSMSVMHRHINGDYSNLIVKDEKQKRYYHYKENGMPPEDKGTYKLVDNADSVRYTSIGNLTLKLYSEVYYQPSMSTKFEKIEWTQNRHSELGAGDWLIIIPRLTCQYEQDADIMQNLGITAADSIKIYGHNKKRNGGIESKVVAEYKNAPFNASVFYTLPSRSTELFDFYTVDIALNTFQTYDYFCQGAENKFPIGIKTDVPSMHNLRPENEMLYSLDIRRRAIEPESRLDAKFAGSKMTIDTRVVIEKYINDAYAGVATNRIDRQFLFVTYGDTTERHELQGASFSVSDAKPAIYTLVTDFTVDDHSVRSVIGFSCGTDYVKQDITWQGEHITTNLPLEYEVGQSTEGMYEFVGLLGAEVASCSSQGNILILCSDTRKFYYRFLKNNYEFLGNDIPNIRFKFMLKQSADHGPTVRDVKYNNEVAPLLVVRNADGSSEGGYRAGYGTKIFWNYTSLYADMSDIPADDRTRMRDGVSAIINKAIYDQHERGLFTQPFFVRSAIRLTDGTTTKCSQPVLMMPVDTVNPVCLPTSKSSNDSIVLTPFYQSFYLTYEVCEEDYHTFSLWRDIIQSVDVAITRPIYQYDTTGTELRHLNGATYQSAVSLHDRGETFHDIYVNNREELDNIAGRQGSYIDYLHFKSSFCRLFDAKDSSSLIRRADIISAYNPSNVTKNMYFSADHLSSDKLTQLGITNEDGSPIQSNDDFIESPNEAIFLALKSEEDRVSELLNHGPFYIIQSLSFDDIEAAIETQKKPVIGILDNNINYIRFKRGQLNSLETSDVLDDEYLSHDYIMPRNITVYNSRINMSAITRFVFGSESLDTLALSYTNHEQRDTSKSTARYKMLVAIQESSGYVVTESVEEELISDLYLTYLYYPNPNAKEVYIIKTVDGQQTYLRLKLQPHLSLNGAHFINGSSFDMPQQWRPYSEAVIRKTDSQSINESNIVYTSEVDNPFVFRAANVEQIGNGRIIALTPQAIAMSQGQFGEYPMMCFTTDGIWALSVNATGGWAAKQPFSRDVVLNEDAGNILQLDREIIFASSRGLMHIAGTNVTCISEVFDGMPDRFTVITKAIEQTDGYGFLVEKLLTSESLSDIPAVRPDAIFAETLESPDDGEEVPSEEEASQLEQSIQSGRSATSSFRPSYSFDQSSDEVAVPEIPTSANITTDHICFNFREFMHNAVMLYDYTHQRIIIGNPDRIFALIYSITDRLWSSIQQCITSSVNSYPQCYAMTKAPDGSNLLVDFSRSSIDSETAVIISEAEAKQAAYSVAMPHDGFILTRPFHLGRPDQHKTISQAIVRGNYNKGHAALVLLGSRDLVNWLVIGSTTNGRLIRHHGTSYRYFRLAIITRLHAGESIESVDVEYQTKHDNKIR